MNLETGLITAFTHLVLVEPVSICPSNREENGTGRAPGQMPCPARRIFCCIGSFADTSLGVFAAARTHTGPEGPRHGQAGEMGAASLMLCNELDVGCGLRGTAGSARLAKGRLLAKCLGGTPAPSPR